MSNFRESSRNLGHFWKFKKFQTLKTHIIYHFEASDLEIPNL